MLYKLILIVPISLKMCKEAFEGWGIFSRNDQSFWRKHFDRASGFWRECRGRRVPNTRAFHPLSPAPWRESTLNNMSEAEEGLKGKPVGSLRVLSSLGYCLSFLKRLKNIFRELKLQ